jgi:hypothetical protein
MTTTSTSTAALREPRPVVGRHGAPSVGRPALRASNISPGSCVLLAVAGSALGLLIQCIGYERAFVGRGNGVLFCFYLGYTVLVAPIAALMLSHRLDRRQRVLSLALLGVALFASYFLTSPLFFSRFDETLHSGALLSLLDGRGFGALDTMLPVAPHYPGLETATAGLRWATGLSAFAAQVTFVLALRVLLVLILFLLIERYTRSARSAGIGVVLYMASPPFYFFNAQYAYETLAIVLLVGVIYWTQLALDRRRENRSSRGSVALVLMLLAMLTVTHHLTSWIMVGILLIWACLLWAGADRPAARVVGLFTLVGALMVVGWTLPFTALIANYVGPLFGLAGSQLAKILGRQSGSRKLFVSNGVVTPRWEQVVILFSILAWLGALVPALLAAARRRTLGGSNARWFPIVIASTYPLLLVARLSPVASDISDRSSTFVFFAIAVVVAAWATGIHVAGRRMVAGGVALAILLVGGMMLGSGPDFQRVPGGFLPSAQNRSNDPATLAAAEWVEHNMPRGARFAADFTDGALFPTVADVQSVTAGGGIANVTPLFFGNTVTPFDRQLIRSAGIDFIVIDTRIAGKEPLTDWYFEPGTKYDNKIPSAVALDKFATAKGFKKVVSGPVEIYDTRAIRGVPLTYANQDLSRFDNANYLQLAIFGALLALGLAFWRPTRRALDTNVAVGLVGVFGLMVVGAIGVVSSSDETSVRVIALVATAGAVGFAAARRRTLRPVLRLSVGMTRRAVATRVVLATIVVGLTAASVALSLHGAVAQRNTLGSQESSVATGAAL